MGLNIKRRTRRRSGSREISILINSQKGGTNTNTDEARLSPEQASESINLLQVQDGLWSTKWGTGYYGNPVSGESGLDGATEYIDSNGDRELVVVGATTGAVYKSTDDGANWTSISGATMTTGNQCFFLQVADQLWITNSTDRLTIYNGTSLSRNTQLSAPANLAANRGAGLSAGSYTYYYQVTALNEVGFTNGSTEASETVNKLRDVWSGATEVIDLTWDAVASATRYEVYIADETGSQIYLGSSTTNSFSDDGTAEPNPFVEVPADNTTGGPIMSRIEWSGNRVWGVDTENKRVVFSGTGQYRTYFSSFYGGGYAYLEKGGRDTPKAVVHYRSGKGDSVATVLASSPEGRGSIWQIAFDSITIASTTVTVPTPAKVVGSIGSDSALGVVLGGDNVYFPNKKGVYALRNKVQLFNVLATSEQSINIRPDYRSIAPSKVKDICGYFYEGKVFYSCSVGGSVNDATFIYDIERNNWSWRWTNGFKQFFEFTDGNEDSKLLGIQPNSNQLVEISENYDSDLGTAFRTSWVSPLIHVNPKDKSVFAKFDKALLELGRPKGTINFEVLGLEKNRAFSTISSRQITDTVSSVDFCNALFGDYEFGSDDATPDTFSQATVKKELDIKKLLNAIQFKVSSTQSGTQYTILSAMAKGRIVPTRSPSSWRN